MTSERRLLTPWTTAVPVGTRVDVRSYRVPGSDYPLVAVWVESWTAHGYRWIRLGRGVRYVSRRGPPLWVWRASSAVAAAIDGAATAIELCRVAEQARQGQGIKRRGALLLSAF